MSVRDLSQQRLYHHRLPQQDFKTPAGVVEWLGAIQAQDYHASLWAIAVRMPNASVEDIEQAIDDRQIIRTWTQRGTLHAAPPADARWMLQLMTPRVIARGAKNYRDNGLDDHVFKRAHDIFGKALTGGKQLSRPELYQLLDENGIASQQRGIYILSYLAQTGVLCLSAREGKQPTFALLEEWVTKHNTPTPDEALALIVRRYLRSHAPATLQDFVWWSGLTVADAKLGFAAIKHEFAQEEIDGETYWRAKDMPALKEDTSVYMLPPFDEYVLGPYRNHVMDAAHFPKVVPHKNGLFNGVIVSAGRVIGIWKRKLAKKVVSVTYEPFTTMTAAEHAAFAACVERYGAYLGLAAEIVK